MWLDRRKPQLIAFERMPEVYRILKVIFSDANRIVFSKFIISSNSFFSSLPHFTDVLG